jgi:hypothetical protein
VASASGSSSYSDLSLEVKYWITEFPVKDFVATCGIGPWEVTFASFLHLS